MKSRFGVRFYASPFFQIIAAVLLGIAAGCLFPRQVVLFQSLSDGFVKIMRLIITPIVFVTVAVGIGSVSDLGKAGRTGGKALVYFEVISTLSLFLGLIVVHAFQPGRGLNVDPRTFPNSGISSTVQSAGNVHLAEVILGIIPSGLASPFVDNQLLQVLLLAVLTGVALSKLGANASIIQLGLSQVQKILFTIAGQIMQFLAPPAVFGATAFTIAQYGTKTLLSFASVVGCLYFADVLFVGGVLGLVCALGGFNLWAFLRYIREEVLLVAATAASELAIPSLMKKLEHLGCARSTIGIVLPAGYTFNMDGSSIYMAVGFLFVVQATHSPLAFGRELTVLGVMLVTSKGAAGVPGGAFIALAATLAAFPIVPLSSLALLLGIARFMSMGTSVTNMIGNSVATIIVDKWERTFDSARARGVLAGNAPFVDAGGRGVAYEGGG